MLVEDVGGGLCVRERAAVAGTGAGGAEWDGASNRDARPDFLGGIILCRIKGTGG